MTLRKKAKIVRHASPYGWCAARTAVLALCVIAGCGTSTKPPVAVRSGGAGDASNDATASLDPEHAASPPPSPEDLPVLSADRVAEVYAAVMAGDAHQAASLLRAMPIRSGRALDSRQFAGTALLGNDSNRALVTTEATCSFSDIPDGDCQAAMDLTGGRCERGKLIAPCGQVLLDLRDGSIKAFYQGGSARSFGNFILTFEHAKKTTIRRSTTLEELMAIEGTVVGTLGGDRLVSVVPSSPSDSNSEHEISFVRVLDPAHKTASAPCAVAAPVSDATHFRLLLKDKYLLVSQRGSSADSHTDVAVCALDSGRVVQSFVAVGTNTVLVDHDEKRLFASGILGRSFWRTRSPELKGVYDHRIVDLRTGSVQRLQIEEPMADLPGRDMLLTHDEKTLIVASHMRLTVFGTSPFRKLAALETHVSVLDASYNATPSLRLLPDGKTVLATYVNTSPIPVGGEGRRLQNWVLSTETKRILYRGVSATGWWEDTKHRRGAIVLGGADRVVVTVDEGGLKTRGLSMDEGDSADQRLPSEFVSLALVAPSDGPAERTFASDTPLEPETAVRERLSRALCIASGLIVPKWACP